MRLPVPNLADEAMPVIPASRAPQIFADQVEVLFRGARDASLVTVVNGAFIAYIQRDVVPSFFLYPCIVYLLLVALGRIWLASRYWRATDRMDEAPRWHRRYVVVTGLLGIGWGAAGSLLFPVESIAHQMFLVFVLAGMVSGAAAYLPASKPAFLSFALPLLVPLTLRLLTMGDEVHLFMGIMAVLYGAALWATAWRTHVTIVASLNLRHENRELIAYLTDAKEKAEELNEELRAEIDQRRQAEAALKQSEEQLLQSQKMEAVGKLAGGIAHEFNNILQVIKGSCYFLLPALAQQEPLRQDVEGIEQSADRAATLTSQLLAFSRRQVIIPRVLDLNAVIVEQHRMLARLIGESIKLEVNLAPELPRVKADPAQIGQVLLNLVNNARDAMPEGGLVTIATRHLILRDGAPEEYPGIPRGAYAMLTVRDTGCGMSPEVLERIFEPFFTTKEVGKGTGLGLSTVYGLIAQIGGHIRVASQPGRGACVTILLPAVDKAMDAVGQDLSSAGPLSGTETILVAEDEPAVRKVLHAALSAKGYRVLEAADGRAALQVCQDRSGPIHLAVVDLVMPGMGGLDLIRHLVPRYPNLKVVYMSGYTDQPVDLQDLPHLAKAFLQKPFSSDVFLRTVRNLLDEC
ncbi:MAG: response regulator [Nitrospirota bacterium]|nr:response regulator [Nitrospirota bacterium]MDE3243139.1 response regulator [Nitrospirota bacterium]